MQSLIDLQNCNRKTRANVLAKSKLINPHREYINSRSQANQKALGLCFAAKEQGAIIRKSVHPQTDGKWSTPLQRRKQEAPQQTRHTPYPEDPTAGWVGGDETCSDLKASLMTYFDCFLQVRAILTAQNSPCALSMRHVKTSYQTVTSMNENTLNTWLRFWNIPCQHS